jgi:hypothetical protein
MMPSRFERTHCCRSSFHRDNTAHRDNKTPWPSWRPRHNRVHRDSKARQGNRTPSGRPWPPPPCALETCCWKASRPTPSRSGRVRQPVRQAQTNWYAWKSSNARGFEQIDYKEPERHGRRMKALAETRFILIRSTKPDAIQDLELGRRQMGSQSQRTGDADRSRRKLEAGRDARYVASDIRLFRRADDRQYGLPIGARAGTAGRILADRCRWLLRAARAASSLLF